MEKIQIVVGANKYRIADEKQWDNCRLLRTKDVPESGYRCLYDKTDVDDQTAENVCLCEKHIECEKYIEATTISATQLNDHLRRQREFEQTLEKAKKGDVEGASLVGYKYLWGDGVHSNLTEGIKWMTWASLQGCVSAMYELADYYTHSLKYHISDEVVLKEYYMLAFGMYKEILRRRFAIRFSGKKAQMERGDYGSVYGNSIFGLVECNIAYHYEKGLGVEQNVEKALKWYKKAAKDKSNAAKLWLKEETKKGRKK